MDTRRRVLLSRICSALITALVALVFAAPALFSLAAGIENPSENSFAGVWFVLAAMPIGITNFYLSFVRPLMLIRKHGSFEGQSHVSGLPLIGTLLVYAGIALGYGAVSTAILGVVVLAMDTGGLPWFAFTLVESFRKHD